MTNQQEHIAEQLEKAKPLIELLTAYPEFGREHSSIADRISAHSQWNQDALGALLYLINLLSTEKKIEMKPIYELYQKAETAYKLAIDTDKKSLKITESRALGYKTRVGKLEQKYKR